MGPGRRPAAGSRCQGDRGRWQGSGKRGKAKKGDGLQKVQEPVVEEVEPEAAATQASSAADLLKEATEVILYFKLTALVAKARYGTWAVEQPCEMLPKAMDARVFWIPEPPLP